MCFVATVILLSSGIEHLVPASVEIFWWKYFICVSMLRPENEVVMCSTPKTKIQCCRLNRYCVHLVWYLPICVVYFMPNLNTCFTDILLTFCCVKYFFFCRLYLTIDHFHWMLLCTVCGNTTDFNYNYIWAEPNFWEKCQIMLCFSKKSQNLSKLCGRLTVR